MTNASATNVLSSSTRTTTNTTVSTTSRTASFITGSPRLVRGAGCGAGEPAGATPLTVGRSPGAGAASGARGPGTFQSSFGLIAPLVREKNGHAGAGGRRRPRPPVHYAGIGGARPGRRSLRPG